MFNFIKKILGIHIHEFGRWDLTKTMISENGHVIKIYQHRVCITCGYVQIDSKTTS